MWQSKFNLGLSVLFTLLFTGITNHLFAQAPNKAWERSYGGAREENITELILQSDGGYIIFGTTDSDGGSGDVLNSHGMMDIWIVRINASGQILWQKTIGGTGNDLVQDAKQTPDGGYIIVGETSSTNGDITINSHGNYDMLVMKLDSLCNIQWQKGYGGSNSEVGRSVSLTNDGGYIFGAGTQSTDGDISVSNTGNNPNFFFDYWVVKTDSIGNLEWERAMGGYFGDDICAIEQTADGSYLIAGTSSSDDGDITDQPQNSIYGLADIWLLKLASNGSTIWTKSLGGSQGDFAYQMIKTSDGNYALCGKTNSHNGDVTNLNNHGSNFDFWILKIDDAANVLWNKAYGGVNGNMAYDIQETSDNGLVVIGLGSHGGNVTPSPYAGKYWVLKLDNIGNIQWDRLIGGDLPVGLSPNTNLCIIKETPDYGFIASCSTNDLYTIGNHGRTDIWVARLGAFDVTSSSTPTNCYNSADGTATASAIGGTPPYTYTWSNGMTGDVQTGLLAGVYTVTIIDSNGAGTTTTQRVDRPEDFYITATATSVSCYGGQNANIHVAVSGATPPYTFEWDNGVTTPNRLGIPVGTYTLTITDANACQLTYTRTITQPLPITANMSATPNNGTNNGTATVVAAGGVGPYVYNWSNSASTSVLTGLSEGTYGVIVRDANGCTASFTTTVGLNVSTTEISTNSHLFQLYPNPTQDLFTLSFTDLSLVQDAQVIIYNSLGQVLFSQAVTSDKLTIDLSNQVSGLYWVQLKTKENVILTKPIIKL